MRHSSACGCHRFVRSGKWMKGEVCNIRWKPDEPLDGCFERADETTFPWQERLRRGDIRRIDGWIGWENGNSRLCTFSHLRWIMRHLRTLILYTIYIMHIYRSKRILILTVGFPRRVNFESIYRGGNCREKSTNVPIMSNPIKFDMHCKVLLINIISKALFIKAHDFA